MPVRDRYLAPSIVEVICPLALIVVAATDEGVVAPTVPLMFIEAVPVRFVTVPLAGVPRIAPLPNVATPVTPSVLLNVPVVAATDEGVVAPSVPFIFIPDKDVKVPAAGVTLPIALGLVNNEVMSMFRVPLLLPSIGR